MCLNSLIIEQIWNTDDDDLILSERFARNAVESVGLVLAMYLGSRKSNSALGSILGGVLRTQSNEGLSSPKCQGLSGTLSNETG